MSEEATLNEFTNTQHSEERKETPIGELPSDWDVKWLNDVVSINSDGFSEDNWPSKTFEYISLSEVSNGEIERSRTTPINEAPSRAQRTIQQGDVLVGTVRPKQRSHGFVSAEHDGKICSSGFGALRPGPNLNSRYLIQEILSNRFFSQMEAYVAGSGYPAVKISDLKKHRVSVPPLSEQRKIATVLYTVDQAIEKTEEIISQLERTKKGVCQKLFSKGYNDHSEYKSTKYGKIPVEWDIKKLSEVTNQIQAGGTPDTNIPEYYGGDVPWVKTGELSQYRLTKTEQKITEKGLSESAARLFSPGTVLIAMYGATTGEVCFLEIEAATNQACCGIVTTEQLVPEFLFHQLNYLSDYLESLSAGSGQQNISKGIIQKFDVLMPPVEEQNNIIDVLNSIDNSIAKNEHTMERYQRLKRGLMQDLLSGTIRTTDTNIQVPEEVAHYG